MFQYEFMDANDTVSELNSRFEDAVGFRFQEDVHAALILEQLVKEHGRVEVLRAFDRFLEDFRIGSKKRRLLSVNSQLTSSVIRSEFP